MPSYMRSRLTLDKVTQWPDSSCICAEHLSRQADTSLALRRHSPIHSSLTGIETPVNTHQVNAAVDDIAALAEANAKLVAAARGRGTSLSVEDRRHAQSLIRNVTVTIVCIRHSGASACRCKLRTVQ